MNDFVMRSASNRDAEKIRALVFETLREYGLPPDPEGKDADLSDIEESYLKRGGAFEVIEDAEGHLLGTVGLYPLEDEICELRKMYFAPQLRGRGMGLYVLERTVELARRLGFKRITLETASVLERAIKLYTRFGFRPFKLEHVTERCDQAYFLDLQSLSVRAPL